MVSLIKKRFRLKKQGGHKFIRFLSLLLLPVAIIMSCMVFSMLYYDNYLKTEYVKTAKNKMENTFTINELSIKSVIDSVALFESEPSLMRFLSRTSQEDMRNNKEITEAMNTLAKFKERHPHIDNISIVNREREFVITPNGKYEIIPYFYEIYSYQKLMLDYWKYLKPFDYDSYQIQTITKVFDRNNEKTIIPIIFSKIGGTQISELLVINLSVSALLKNMSDTESKIFDTFMLNKSTGELFSVNEGTEKIKDDLLDKIVLNSRLNLISFENLGKVMYIAYSPSESILSYCYLIRLSYADLRMQLLNDTKHASLIGITSILLALFIIYSNTRKIIVSLEKISDAFNADGIAIEDNWNILKCVQCAIEKMILDYKRIKTKLENYVPIVKEKYLTILLESNEYYYRSFVEDFEEQVPFKYNYFGAVVLQLVPSNSFFDKYNNIQYESVSAKFYEVVNLMFDKTFVAYSFPSQKDTLSILLNLENCDASASIKKTIREIEELLVNDADDITLYIGSSGIYAGLDGLRKAYNQAQKTIKPSSFLKKEVKIFPQTNDSKDYSIKLSEEKNISTLLTNGNTEEATKIIYTAIDRAKDSGAPLEQMQQLYAQVFSLIFDIIDKKNIPVSDGSSKNFWERINELKSQSPVHVYKAIAHYLQLIETNITQKNSNKNIDEIISYLQEHYSSDLSLEMVADEFQMSPNYLSKLLKMRSGMLFQEFLSNLRIEKAKILLTSTDKSINDVLLETGFNNRTTFLRAFKRNTGITPSEFRKMQET